MKKLFVLSISALMLLLALTLLGCQSGADVVEVISIFKYEPGTPVPPGGWALGPTNPHPDNVQRSFNTGDKMFVGLRMSDRMEKEVTFSGYAFMNEETGEEIPIDPASDLGPFEPGQVFLLAFNNPWPVPDTPGKYKLKIYQDDMLVASAIFEVIEHMVKE